MLVAVLSPRLAVVLVWIFTPWVDRAFGPIIWPILGILFLPLTTLMYVIVWNTGGRGVTGWEWIFVILAIFADLASYGGGAYGRRRVAYQSRCGSAVSPTWGDAVRNPCVRGYDRQVPAAWVISTSIPR